MDNSEVPNYSNPALESYECDGQMSLFDFIENGETTSIDRDRSNKGTTLRKEF